MHHDIHNYIKCIDEKVSKLQERQKLLLDISQARGNLRDLVDIRIRMKKWKLKCPFREGLYKPFHAISEMKEGPTLFGSKKEIGGDSEDTLKG